MKPFAYDIYINNKNPVNPIHLSEKYVLIYLSFTILFFIFVFVDKASITTFLSSQNDSSHENRYLPPPLKLNKNSIHILHISRCQRHFLLDILLSLFYLQTF